MSQVFSEERIRQMRSLLPKRKSAEKPETLSDKEQARVRLMDLADRRAREGEQFQQTPGELLREQIGSTKLGMPLASERRAKEQGVRRQARLDKQKRLREVRAAIRSITVLLNKKSLDGKGNMVYDIFPGSEDEIEMKNERSVLRKERDEIEGKASKSKDDDPEGLYP